MLVAAFVGWAAGVFLVPLLGDAEPGPIFGLTPALILAFVFAIAVRVRRCGRPRVAVDIGSRRPDHRRHDHQYRGLRDHGIPVQPHVGEFTGRSRVVRPVRATRSTRSTSRSSAGSSTCSCPRARSGSRCSSWSSSFRCCSSEHAGACGRGRWANTHEQPKRSASTSSRLRYRNVIVAGGLAALGGAFLSMEVTGSFTQGMTAGRGFIGLAAMIIGRWTPLGAFGAALLFASSAAIGQSDRHLSPCRRTRRLPGPAARAGVRCASLRRDNRRARWRRRAERSAGRGWPALRARGNDLTSESRGERLEANCRHP